MQLCQFNCLTDRKLLCKNMEEKIHYSQCLQAYSYVCAMYITMGALKLYAFMLYEINCLFQGTL